MKYFFLLAFYLSSFASLACTISLPYQLVIFNDNSSGKTAYRSTNCTSSAHDEFHHVITGLEGRIASFQLEEIMSDRGHNIQIIPNSIHIQQFRSLIREQLNLPSSLQVKKVNAENTPGILALPAGDKVTVDCPSCNYGNQQPLLITILGFDGTKQFINGTAEFKKMVKAYRLISPVSSFGSLDDPTLFKEEYVESVPHTDFITDIESLRFYITNKALKAGELLKRSDLNAINLVKAGLKTDVVLENQVIRIKTSGISRSNGSIGELVEVYHPQKNKKYQGKVIDINKVLVEL